MNEENIFSSISRLAEAYKEYYQTVELGKFDLQAFALWLYNSEFQRKNDVIEDAYKNEIGKSSIHGNADDQISFILLNMQRLIKFYVKKAVEGTKLVGIDDIHFLMFLAHNESMKKSEIINLNITEMSSGIEVIKRLIKNELIEDFDDPDDKRSKRVRITQKGIDEIKKVSSMFMNIHQLIGKPLEEKEKIPLLASLLKLYNFHISIFNNEKNTALIEIINKHST